MTFCLINGRLVADADAAVSIRDRGFRYGDGVFETLAVEDGVPYQFDWHVRRLSGGLAALKINFDVKGLLGDVRLLLQKNAVAHGLLRIQVTRGTGSRGYLPEASTPTCVIETLPLPQVGEQPVALWQSQHVKISPHALPVQYKLCQGVSSTLARIEADEQHCADALLLSEHGHIAETSSGNIFWLKDGMLYTPALSCGILEGATRAAVLRLSPYPAQEVEAPLQALAQAEAVFITNTVWRALAVGRLRPSDAAWNSAALAADMRARLTADRAAYAREHRSKWQAGPEVSEKYSVS